MTHVPYNITDDTISVLLNGTSYDVEVGDDSTLGSAIEAEIRALLADQDGAEDRLLGLLDPQRRIATLLDGSGVQINGRTVTYRNEPVPDVLAHKLIEMAAGGFPLNPWKLFVKHIYDNPSETSREEIFLFLEAGKFAVTEDGCFMAYKRVREDFTDCYSGKFDNSPGQTVEMERSEVDADRQRTCSQGLHFCSKAYLPNFYAHGGKVVSVKVNPADVVSIPADYNNTKGRTWRYSVIEELDTSTDELKHEWGIYVDAPSNAPKFDDWSDEHDEDFVSDKPVDFEPTFDEVVDTPKVEKREGIWGRIKSFTTKS